MKIPSRGLGVLFTVVFLSATLTLMSYRLIQNALLFEVIILSCLSSSIVCLIFEFIFRAKRDFFIATLIIGFSTLIAFNLLFFSLMMIDRSKSLYLVRWVGECAPITRKELLSAVSETLEQNDYDYLNRRINEQRVRGIVTLNINSEMELSDFGQIIYQVSNGLAEVYSLDGWEKISISKNKNCTSS